MAENDPNTTPYPPADWDIIPVEQFATHAIESVVEPLEGLLVLNVDRNTAIRGNFRFILDGKEKLNIDHLASELLVVGGASSFKLQWQTWPKDILLRQNSLTSSWTDVADRCVDSNPQVPIFSPDPGPQPVRIFLTLFKKMTATFLLTQMVQVPLYVNASFFA
jgi:hypothetical protein